jgi:hypothetical protein
LNGKRCSFPRSLIYKQYFEELLSKSLVDKIMEVIDVYTISNTGYFYNKGKFF